MLWSEKLEEVKRNGRVERGKDKLEEFRDCTHNFEILIIRGAWKIVEGINKKKR